ncbi:MAG: PfaD family polyunsaturated fatty acid/polyketide biosynthesis protein [Firmicutes bacterium]|nr:PfaD family polyunsaturated fatty acid/polyketide biosynthesis protein [Bacillota bacterium]
MRSKNSIITAKTLGSDSFKKDYKTEYAYYAGSMANGISSAKMAIALGKAGYMCGYGAGGLTLHEVEQAIDKIKQALPDGPCLINLLHSQNDLAREEAMVTLFLEKSVKAVEASAFIEISPALIRYRLAGLKKCDKLGVYSENRIIAKVSREEVARKFMSPPSPAVVAELLAKGIITAQQAEWANQIPVADDVTAEADSGGHTDGQPFISLLPLMISVRDKMQQQFGYSQRIRIGAAGGISTAIAAVGAFQMGADYVVTGSVNQACIEAGTSDYVKKMLANTQMSDVVLAPSADMFESGSKVQVIKKGTMFPMNAQKLYDLYVRHDNIHDLPEKDRKAVETRIFRHDFATVWGFVEEYFSKADPRLLDRAQSNPKLKMALTFRWYLGNSSRWAIKGDEARKMDMQIWCGKSMGAFNRWVENTELEQWDNRTVVKVADKIMNEAATIIMKNYTKLS